jgi:hypothetical protein
MHRDDPVGVPGYPTELLAREPAPSYEGEGPFTLWHFSEEPSLGRFVPRALATDPAGPPLVWAVDSRHAPTFWFPRDCPRGCIWPVSTTTDEDRERFFGQSRMRWAGTAPSIWPFWRRVVNSTVEFSGSRLRNAAAHPERFS